MKIQSAQGGEWEIEANGYNWEAYHSSYEPDHEHYPSFHQHTSARTLEELYTAIAETDADALEERDMAIAEDVAAQRDEDRRLEGR